MAKIINGESAINGKVGKISKVNKQRGWNKRGRLAQSMIALFLFIKILLGVCLRKRLDQARNVLLF